ncbi:GlxA family transcriptional regulator [Plantactinospora sp. GCM10030261]|uniref:GlxA family transcriptional regulator n=1 Tax=Plantactinospora sp. GCM10030261 TaxID=3273420 RepID=UPI00361843FF
MAAGGDRDVVVVVYDDVVLLDLSGPVQVFHAAGGYRVRLASPGGGPVTSNVGIPLGGGLDLAAIDNPIHTLLVPGFPPHRQPTLRTVAEQVRRLDPLAQRVVSVCTGALVLAEAGLLAGRQATTHWAACADLADRFPDVSVRPNAIHVRDGRFHTSAGVTAGIDLALALVAADHGPEAARMVARWLVTFFQRPGGQAQFSIRTAAGAPRRWPLRRVVDAVRADPAGDHNVTTMAGLAAVSPRHLTRLFRAEMGTTPAQYVERVRVETAQGLLETSDLGVEVIARRCGFGSSETMRRAFLDDLDITPTAYRQRFRSSSA